jgi:hypothetical protein
VPTPEPVKCVSVCVYVNSKTAIVISQFLVCFHTHLACRYATGGQLACVFCATDVARSRDILSEQHVIYGKPAFYVNKGVDGAIGGALHVELI